MKKTNKSMSKSKLVVKPTVKTTVNKSDKITYDTVTYDNVSLTHPVLEKYLGYLLNKTTVLYKARINKEFEKLQLQGPHFVIMCIIDATPSVNQIKVCSDSGIDKATMVKIVDHLVRCDYLERIESTDDRRVKHLELTRKGRAALLRAQEFRQNVEKEYLSVLTSDEQKNLKQMLLKVIHSNIKLPR